MIKFSNLVQFLTYKGSSTIIPQGWKLLLSSDDLKSQNLPISAFINEQQDRIIITTSNLHSSTSMGQLYNEIVSWIEIYNNDSPSHFRDASIPFLNKLFKILPSDISNLKFFNIGHSAGSIISDVMTTYMLEKGLNAKSYTFENPGSKTVVEKYTSQTKLKIDSIKDNFTSINIIDSYLSNQNPQLGNVIKVTPLTNNSWIDTLETMYNHSNSFSKFFLNNYNLFEKICGSKLNINTAISIEYITKNFMFQIAGNIFNTFGSQLIDISKSFQYHSPDNLSEMINNHENLNPVNHDICSPTQGICD